MPCTDGGAPYESYSYSELNKIRKRNDVLASENDRLREVIMAIHARPDLPIPDDVMRIINQDQVKHRKDDLKRLQAFFLKADADSIPDLPTKLGKVLLASPRKPLEPQLGFSPDDY
jgi:hypothetical protein